MPSESFPIKNEIVLNLRRMSDANSDVRTFEPIGASYHLSPFLGEG